MKRTFFAASLMLAFFVSVALLLSLNARSTTVQAATAPMPVLPPPPLCAKFGAEQTATYATRIFAGTRLVTRHERQWLAYMENCQRYSGVTAWVKHYDQRLAKRHATRIKAAAAVASWSWADASWYDDAGSTACGFHAVLGVANKTLPCGTHVTFRYHGLTVGAVVQDRGPYVGDRMWDLNQGLAAALGYSGIDPVQYHIP